MARNRKSVFYVTGSKGGVGKSLVAMALTDFLLDRGESIALIESDLTNPDVAKAYGSIVKAFQTLELDDADGWIDLVNFCAAHPDHHVVVNTGARNQRGVVRHGRIVNQLDAIGRRFVALWTINTQRDSLELLHDYREAMQPPGHRRPIGKMHIVCNSGESYQTDFKLYDESDVAKAIKAEGGEAVQFPTLAKRVADDLYNNRMPISQTEGRMPFGNRAELERWKREVYDAFGQMLRDDL